jgi:hypothetical protein
MGAVRGSEPADQVAVGIEHAHLRHRCCTEALLSPRLAQEIFRRECRWRGVVLVGEYCR